MDQLSSEIRPSSTDPECDRIIASIPPSALRPWSIRFTQGEESYLLLEREIEVPSFPIHHDVRIAMPSPGYLDALRSFIASAARAVPALLSGLSYFFDASEIARPCFCRVYRAADELFLYLLRLDVSCRPVHDRITRRGDNDRTAAFSTNKLFFECDLIPLVSASEVEGRPSAFTIRQLVSDTWIGETGKGYMVRGIWMDMDITKYASKLFLQPGTSTHPYYPLVCKYRTICHACTELDPSGREAGIPLLSRALGIIEPAIDGIQEALRSRSFSEDMPGFAELRALVPPDWQEPWSRIRMRPYLDERDQKEYLFDE